MVARYTAALKEYLFEGGEAALQRAYEFGRGALGDGLGVLEVAAVHHQAMVEILGATNDELPGALAAAGQFLAEGLSPFEMTHRGYREANAALQVSERRYRELFENANDVVFTTDLAGKFTSVNRTGENLTGYGRDELASMNFSALVAPEQVPIARRMLERMLTGGVERTRYESDIATGGWGRIQMESQQLLLTQVGM